MKSKDQIIYVFTCAVFMLAGAVLADIWYSDELREANEIMDGYEETVEFMVRERAENEH